MSTSQYYVVGNNDVWMVQFKNAEIGQHKCSNEQTLFAIASAQKLGMRGERAHVCVLDDDGRLRCKWSYNREIVACARKS
jgi:UDP-2,3-diacylglucosamine pyrophosphatase LpxH